MVALATDTLDFLKLTHGSRRLDVLEGDLLVLAEVNNATEVEVQTFCSAVFLEEVDDSGRPEEIRVLLCDVNHSLQILADVDLEHLVETLHGEVNGKAAKVIGQKLLGNLIRLHNAPLYAGTVLVVLERSCQEPSVLAKLCDLRLVIVREHLVAKDGIGDLWRIR